MHLRNALQAEFARRQQRNRSYSLRAFARDLATNHASLSQILHGQRNVSARMAAQLGRRVGLGANEISKCSAVEIDQAVLRAVKSRSFQPASRWIAVRTGISLDAVNLSVVRLLQRGALTMNSTRRWRSRI